MVISLALTDDTAPSTQHKLLQALLCVLTQQDSPDQKPQLKPRGKHNYRTRPLAYLWHCIRSLRARGMKCQLPGKYSLQLYVSSQSTLVVGICEHCVDEEEHNFILSRVPYNCRADTEPSPTHMLLHIFTVGCLRVSNFNYLESTVNTKLPDFFIHYELQRLHLNIPNS